ncbi:MAG: ROK family protein [Terracidiphilus sp.]
MSETAIGIDIGGSHVECGIVCDDRVVLAKTIKVKRASLHPVLLEVEEIVRLLLMEAEIEPSALSGVAVGICAVVDRSGAIAATNGKYDDGVGFNFTGWSEQTFGLRCVVENDTRLALLGEHFAGAAKGFDDAVLVTLGSGIGGAAMLGGKLLNSVGGRAGGLAGHLGVDWQGRLCSCGNRGCGDAEASTSSLPFICREWDGFWESALGRTQEPIDFRLLFSIVERGDRVAREVLDHCIGVWSALTVSLIHAYDPQAILFGGGVMRRHELILPGIRDYVARHAWQGKDPVRIVPAALDGSAALLGALPLLRGQT